MTSACRLSRWTETYLDGELSPEHTVDFEDHLSGCCCCQAKLKFEQALRFSMRRTTRIATYPSEGFETKLRALMATERESAERNSADQSEARVHDQLEKANSRPQAAPIVSHRPLTWRAIAPLSVAAAAALVFAALRNQPSDAIMVGDLSPASADGRSIRAKDTMQTVQEFLDQLAADTEHNPDPSAALVEESEPVFVPALQPSVIHVSQNRRWPVPRFEDLGGIWEGLRYRNLAVQDRVPSLHYRIGGHRVLLWAYDSQRVPLRVVLEPRVARNHPVFVGSRHGLAIAAVEREGQGFVATTDLSQSEAAELVVTAAAR